MRTYVSTLGFHSTRVTRPVLKQGLDSGDRIVLLRPADDDGGERAAEAISDIEDIVGQIDPDISVTVEQLPADDFTQTVREAVRVLDEATGEVIVTFGGGPREIFLPFTVAALVLRDEIDESLQFNDIDGSVQEVQLPDLLTPISDTAMETLGVVDELGGETTLPAIVEAHDRAKSTVGRHLDALESAGAVETTQEGKTRLVGLTLAGELRLTHQ